MAKWFQKTPESLAPEVVERVEPVEIPIITDTKRRLANGDYFDALRAAYLQVLTDVERAYELKIPPGRTHGEILSMEFPERMGHLPEFLRRLYALYQPVRYGPEPWPRDDKLLSSLLQSLYAPRPMWALYIEAKREGATPAPPPSPSKSAAGPIARDSGAA